MTLLTKSRLYLNTITKTLLLTFVLFSCTEDNQEDLKETSLETVSFSKQSSSSTKIDIESVSASETYESYVADNTIDDSYSTMWRADGESINLIADLGSTKSVDYIRLSHSSGTSREYDFEVWVRESSSVSWVKLDKYTTAGESTSLVDYDITDSYARYVRVKCNGNNVNTKNEIKKFEVWGEGSESNDDDDDNYDNDYYSSSDSTKPVNSNTFEIEDFLIESSWNTSDTSREEELASDISDDDYEDWEEFYYMSNDELVLVSPIKHGERTEFKENKGLESSLETYKEMEYKATVTNIPNNGVTIAQIHNRGGVNRPYARVYIEDGEVNIKETVTDPSESSSDYKTYPEYDNDSALKYTEGTSLTVKIETNDGEANITITTTHGSYSKTLKPNEISDWDDFSDEYYLKAGAYTEGDDEKPAITFSSIKMDR